jgi:histidyl-tRNA synthetase
MIMVARLWKILGVEPVRLEINCLGQADERALHREALIAYFQRHATVLDADAQRRLHTNPLRILDSKNPAMAEMIAGAPRITEFLGDASRLFFERVQHLLHSAGLSFTVNSRMVRGLDYYNLTVFEWITDAIGAQGTLCGGGRYDPLIAQLGGKPTPACGFGIGVERVLELIKERGQVDSAPSADVYVLHQGGNTQDAALKVSEQLRDAGLDVLMHAGEASLKSQMKRADASGAEFAVIVGADELAAGAVAVKALRGRAEGDRFAAQQIVAIESLGDALVDALAAEPV